MKASRLRAGDRIRRKDGSIAAVLTVVHVGDRDVQCQCDAYRGLDGPDDEGRVVVPMWQAQHQYEVIRA